MGIASCELQSVNISERVGKDVCHVFIWGYHFIQPEDPNSDLVHESRLPFQHRRFNTKCTCQKFEGIELNSWADIIHIARQLISSSCIISNYLSPHIYLNFPKARAFVISFHKLQLALLYSSTKDCPHGYGNNL